ncbi:asparagine synthase (glutamine-hydrolyzing) [Aquirufa nivalisilvae]
MCGICGVISKKAKEDREVQVFGMNQAIYHRGLDDDGFFSNETCTLAMRRLAIIDLKTGKQPLYSDCGRYLIFFNGEIYNYKELKETLVALSCEFVSNSDTEVVVNLFKYFGKDMVSKLQGMFAFCIYDLVENSYFFARDRFGEKPFYYHFEDGNFIFSSEVKSLLASKSFVPKLNKSKLGSYLRLGYVDEPFTLIQHVYSLAPGCYLELTSDRQISIKSYAHTTYRPDKSIKSLEEASNFIRPYFEKAVQKQLVSDVPIGAFLSGGIDSSSVVAMMAQLSDKPIQTFTVKFQTKGYDESKIARLVSERYHTDHHEIIVENSQFKEAQFWRILDHVGLPFPDSSAIPTDIVTGEISKYVKVALSGDGGDEVFGGYTVFDWLSKLRLMSYVPLGLRSLGQWGISTLNHGLNNNKLRQLTKVLKISGLPIPRLIQETHALFDSSELEELCQGQLDYPEYEDYQIEDSLLRNAMRYRVKYDLPLDMLIKVDRMSMANSLEVRSPFLDPVLFEASCALPDQFLRNKGLGKLVIRKMMENSLPEEVFNHPKSGFSIPLHDFRNKEFKSLAKELLFTPYMVELFERESLEKVLLSGITETKDNGSGSIYRKTHQLWSLMMLSGWIKRFEVSI